MEEQEKELERRLSILLNAKYGRTYKIGPKILTTVARVAVLEGWVTQESVHNININPPNLWNDIEDNLATKIANQLDN